LKMSVNGMGFRAIERVKGVHHTTVIYCLSKLENACQMPMNQRLPLKWENWM
jgi:transposase-like protein